MILIKDRHSETVEGYKDALGGNMILIKDRHQTYLISSNNSFEGK